MRDCAVSQVYRLIPICGKLQEFVGVQLRGQPPCGVGSSCALIPRFLAIITFNKGT